MKLLQSLLTEKGSDLSRLPKDVVTAIKSNIRKGAENLQQKWANALELCQKAYEVEGVQRPTPDMGEAWKQYEENLQYAVQQLATNRGMDADWRMSSAMFHEAQKPKSRFSVKIGDTSYITESDSVEHIINTLSQTATGMTPTVTENTNSHTITFSKWGIKHKTTITIESVE